MYREFLFKDDVYGANASAFITDYCVGARERLRSYSQKAQKEHKGNTAALQHLAGKVKYALSHLELAECYAKQIGVMTEHRMFREYALAYISTLQAELEGLEYFHHE
jgi:hypothetical protein